MASHGNDGAGSVVHRFTSSRQEEGRLLLLHRQQRTLECVGLAGRGLGPDHLATLSVCNESPGLEKKYPAAGLPMSFHGGPTAAIDLPAPRGG